MTDGRRPGLHLEPARDPRLAEAIRQAEGPPASDARLELLRARIAAATEATLRAAREPAWWEWTARWARAEVALSAAAAIIALIVAFSTQASSTDSPSDSARASVPSVGVDSVVATAVVAGASGDQVMTAIVGPLADAEWLLQAAASRTPAPTP